MQELQDDKLIYSRQIKSLEMDLSQIKRKLEDIENKTQQKIAENETLRVSYGGAPPFSEVAVQLKDWIIFHRLQYKRHPSHLKK